MRAIEIRNKYIEFFKEKNHTQIQGASLVPENDNSVLYTPAGMHPLIPYFQGAKHPRRKKTCKLSKMYKNNRY